MPPTPASAPIDAYIAALPEPARGRFERLRATVVAAAPEARERISYGLPTWHQGENLVHLGAFAGHIGIYPGPAAIEAFAEELRAYRTSKGAARVPHDAELPLELLRRIVEWRVAQVSTGSSRP